MPDYPQEGALRGGHIPGAASVPWKRAANEDGTFKTADELKAIYAGRARAQPERRRDRLLPHRRAVEPHLVRAAAPARLPDRAQLRRLVDGVGQPGPGPDRKALTRKRAPGGPAVPQLRPAQPKTLRMGDGVAVRPPKWRPAGGLDAPRPMNASPLLL